MKYFGFKFVKKLISQANYSFKVF